MMRSTVIDALTAEVHLEQSRNQLSQAQVNRDLVIAQLSDIDRGQYQAVMTKSLNKAAEILSNPDIASKLESVVAAL